MIQGFPLTEISHVKTDMLSIAIGMGNTLKISAFDMEKNPFSGKVVFLETSGGKTVRVSPDYLIPSRIGTRCRDFFYVILIFSEKYGFSLAFLKEHQFWSIREYFDELWIIQATPSLKEAFFFLQFYSIRYGIPNLNQLMDNNLLDPSEILRLLKMVKNEQSTQQLMNDLLLKRNYPHFSRKEIEPRQKVLHLTLYGAQERTDGICHHLLDLNLPQTSIKTGKQKRKYEDLHWNMEKIRVSKRDYRELLQFARTLTSLEEIHLKIRIQAGTREPFYLIPTSHLRVGMVIPVLEDQRVEEEEIVKVVFEEYSGTLVDFKIQEEFNFFFHGILFATQLPK